MRVSNKSCRSWVQRREPFKANHLFAERANGFYVVYSYGHHWPLWAFDGQVWYENVDKYSSSTSRHKSQSRPTPGPTFKCGLGQMRDVIAGGVYKEEVHA